MARRARVLAIISTTITTTTAFWVETCLRKGGQCPPWASREEPWHPLLGVQHQMAATPHIHPTPWWARHPSSTRDPRNGWKRCEADVLNGQCIVSSCFPMLTYLGLMVKHTSCTVSRSVGGILLQLSRLWPLHKLTMNKLKWGEKIFCSFFMLPIMSIVSLK